MRNHSLQHLSELLLAFPLDTLDRTALHKLWISGFANCDDLVRENYIFFKELDDIQNLPELIRKASCVTEELIQHYATSTNGDLPKDSEEMPQDDNENHTSTSEDGQSTDEATPTLPPGRNSGPWASLVQSGITQQSVLAFLFIFLQAECCPDIVQSDKELSLVCARFYFNLLCLPGCKAYGIFHSTIFQNAITCLALKNNNNEDKSARSATRKKPTGKGKRKVVVPSSPTSESDENNDIDSPANRPTTPTIPIHIQKELIFEAIVSLENVLTQFPFKEHELLFASTIEKLVELASWDPELVPVIASLVNSGKRPTLQNRSISGQAYRNLLALLVPIHGDINTVFSHVFFRMIPCLIMSGAGNAQTIPRYHILVKEKTVEYVQHLLKQFSPEVLPAARTLLQQVSTRLADRAEFRAKVSQAVVDISSYFPLLERAKMIEWFHILSQNPKAGHRVFTLEVIFGFLNEPEVAGEEVPRKTAVLVSHLGLLKIIVERCDDKSPSVSAKAMSILSSNQLPVKEAFQNADNQIDTHALFKLLINNCNDEKSTIRKSAIQVLERFMCVDEKYLTKFNLGTISLHAQDVNVSVQKQASTSMSNILETYPESDITQNLWLETQLPLVYADENSVQEKGLEALERILLNQVLNNKDLGWTLLEKVSDGCYEDKQQHLRRAFSIWLRENKISIKAALKIVQHHMDGIYDSVAWMLLSFLTLSHKVPELGFVIEACSEEMSKVSPNLVILRRMLQVIIQTAESLPANHLLALLKKLQLNAKQFKFQTPVISVVFLTIEKLMLILYGKDAEERKSEWCLTMITDIHTFFNNTIGFESGVPLLNPDQEEMLVCCVFTLGEVFQFCPWHLPPTMKDFIHNLVGSPLISTDSLSPSCFPLSTPPTTGALTAKVKAHAIITFGKICIGDKEFCKGALLTAVRELRESPEPCIRNNIILTLTDLLVFHANLIESYIPDITVCLRDRSEFVRSQTLAAIAKLLKEDYIKWKGTLYYRILVCCTDESTEVASMAEYCLTQLLLKRNPQSFAHHYIECIFFLNSYIQHESYNQFTAEAKDNLQLFSLKDSPVEREKLYKFLLRSMPDEKRLELHERLCQDILGPIIDGVLPLNADSNGLVKDALMILSCEEIKLTPLAGVHEEEEGTEIEAIRANTRKVITALVRNEVIRSILPIVISLKRELEQRHSPLIRDVELFFKEFLKDFKNEIKDITGEDKQLASEIEYILRQPSETREKECAVQTHQQSPRRHIRAPDLNNCLSEANRDNATKNRRSKGTPSTPKSVNVHSEINSSNSSPKNSSPENNNPKSKTPEKSPRESVRISTEDSVKSTNTKENVSTLISTTIVTSDENTTLRHLTSTPHPQRSNGKSIFQTTMEISNVLSSSNTESDPYP